MAWAFFRSAAGISLDARGSVSIIAEIIFYLYFTDYRNNPLNPAEHRSPPIEEGVLGHTSLRWFSQSSWRT